MKKMMALFLISLIVGYGVSYGQGRNIWASDGTPQYIYVGSLMKDKNSTSNKEKIKIEIFGGSYSSDYLGTTTYGIGTRSQYSIKKSIEGGAHMEDRHILRIYENGDKLDIVIETISWAAFIVRSWILDSNPIAHEVKCVEYDPTGKRNIYDQFSTTIFLGSNANGDIGIGTLDPKSALDVRGKIIADEVQVQVNKGADFVFESNYDLVPLNDVESFIKENKHLPNIPSEQEMKENGLNLNEMQIKLLQKIEELTLYVIEQNKKIEQQQILIESLQNK